MRSSVAAPQFTFTSDEVSSVKVMAEPASGAVAMTDYEGLGTPGRHPYIVGEREARSTIDIVRAARNVSTAHAGDRYVVWGHSQGGHAAMFSLHIADAWAPELQLQGVVAGAPPSQLYLIYQALKTSPFRYYLLMAAAGWNAAYGDQAAPLDAVLTPLGLQTVPEVDNGCADYLYNVTSGFRWEQPIAAWCEALKVAYPKFEYRVAHDDEKANIWYTDRDRGLMDVGRLARDIDFRPHAMPDAYGSYLDWIRKTPEFFT